MNFSEDELMYLNLLKIKLNLNKDLFIFDIGCNKGFYTEKLISTFGSNHNYFLFDPSKRFVEICKNKFQNRKNIKIHNFGLNDINSSGVKFYELESFDPDAEGMSSMINRKVFNNYKVNNYEIECISLDYFFKNNNIQYVDFIKIDTEGNELNILKGCSDYLKSNSIYSIQIEYGDCARERGYDLRTILSYLNNYEYSLYYFQKNMLLKLTEENYVNYNHLSYCNLLIMKNNEIF